MDKRLCQALDQFLVVAPWWADGNSQCRRPQQKKSRAGDDREDQQRGREQREGRVILPAPGGRASV
jgi:hypothetical protein